MDPCIIISQQWYNHIVFYRYTISYRIYRALNKMSCNFSTGCYEGKLLLYLPCEDKDKRSITMCSKRHQKKRNFFYAVNGTALSIICDLNLMCRSCDSYSTAEFSILNSFGYRKHISQT